MAKSHLVDKDLGWREMFRRVEEIKDAGVKVGVLADSELGGMHVPGGKLTVAEIAAVHEFGTRDKRIPARPFLRPTFDTQRERLIEMSKQLITKVLSGKMDVEQALNMLGASFASDVKKAIASNIPPPNKESTLLRKAMKGKGVAKAQEKAEMAIRDSGRTFKPGAKIQMRTGKEMDKALTKAAGARGAALKILDASKAGVKTLIDTGRMLGAVSWAIMQKGEKEK